MALRKRSERSRDDGPALGLQDRNLRVRGRGLVAEPGVVGELLGEPDPKNPEALSRARRCQPTGQRGGLANAVDVLQQMHPGRLHDVVDVARLQPVATRDIADQPVESRHEPVPGGVVALTGAAHKTGEVVLGVAQRRSGSRIAAAVERPSCDGEVRAMEVS